MKQKSVSHSPGLRETISGRVDHLHYYHTDVYIMCINVFLKTCQLQSMDRN
jgi:hypothetical protein